MDNMERYGDYNEVDDTPGGKKKAVSLILKILIFILGGAVAGVLIFRVVLFSYYPREIKNIYFNDTLAEYYEITGGDIGAETQNIRFPYDDSEDGNFFCDNLIVIKGINQLQVSARLNRSLFDKIAEEYGVTIDPEAEDVFEFSLYRSPSVPADVKEGEAEPIGTLTYVAEDSAVMYHYYKLVFDDVDFGLDEGEYPAKWIRLEIRIKGVEMDQPYTICIYENNDENGKFNDYKLSSKERP